MMFDPIFFKELKMPYKSQFAVINFILLFLVTSYSCTDVPGTDAAQGGIKVFSENPFYWEYKGSPVLLIGGTQDDNLFQIEGVRAHLQLLKSIGGNYIRCTMSSRDEGNLKPYLKNENGLFDLNQPNPYYWNKLDTLLTVCKELDIIAQIEVWATYDFYWGNSAWAENPFNPRLNCNYTAESAGLPNEINLPAQSEVNPFFTSIPDLVHNELVLGYQKQFVDKLLSISLKYNNVLYSSDNETTAHYSWGKYWAAYLHQSARGNGKSIYVTEMWDCWDPTGGEVVDAIAQTPELGRWYAEYQNPAIHETANFSYSLNDTVSYQFLDVANNNAQRGEIHYKTALWVREAVARSGNIRPINNVKIYGGDRENKLWAGSRKDGKERLWRNVFAGHAAVRFHRPPSGIGLNEEAQYQIKSLRMLTNIVNIFDLSPENGILGEREDNEAFCLANKKQSEIVVYFPNKGSVEITAEAGNYAVSRMSVSRSQIEESGTVVLPGTIEHGVEEDCVYILRKTK